MAREVLTQTHTLSENQTRWIDTALRGLLTKIGLRSGIIGDQPQHAALYSPQ